MIREIKRIIRAVLETITLLFDYKLSHISSFDTPATSASAIKDLLRQLRPLAIKQPLIRLGPDGDGGYLIPEDLKGVTACFSPGVSSISGFEMDCADKGINVYLADASVDQPPSESDKFDFIKKYIGQRNSPDFITLEDWVSRKTRGDEGDLILQMDIEGYEYEALLSCSQGVLNQFRIIVIEFHNLDMLWSKPFFSLAASVFEKILSTHDCVHIHPNNYLMPYEKEGIQIPPLMEFTFLRKDRVVTSNHSLSFPHPLDFDNTQKTSFSLPQCWYE